MASLESRLAVGGRRTLRWTSQSDSEEEEDDASSKQSFEERDDEAATIAEGSGWASDGPGKRWDLVDSEDDATAGMTRDGTMSGAATRRAAARFSGAQGGLADDAAAFHSVRSTEVARGASATAIIRRLPLLWYHAEISRRAEHVRRGRDARWRREGGGVFLARQGDMLVG